MTSVANANANAGANASKAVRFNADKSDHKAKATNPGLSRGRSYRAIEKVEGFIHPEDVSGIKKIIEKVCLHYFKDIKAANSLNTNIDDDTVKEIKSRMEKIIVESDKNCLPDSDAFFSEKLKDDDLHIFLYKHSKDSTSGGISKIEATAYYPLYGRIQASGGLKDFITALRIHMVVHEGGTIILGRLVAKLTAQKSHSEHVLEHFDREIRHQQTSLADVPNVCQVLHASIHQSENDAVERVIYTDLADYSIRELPKQIRELPKQINVKDRAHYLHKMSGQLLIALREIHRKNLVHGDIKQDNILSRHFNAMFSDFGSMRLLHTCMNVYFCPSADKREKPTPEEAEEYFESFVSSGYDVRETLRKNSKDGDSKTTDSRAIRKISKENDCRGEASIPGTPDYYPPERDVILHGESTQEGDIWSLGVTFSLLVNGFYPALKNLNVYIHSFHNWIKNKERLQKSDMRIKQGIGKGETVKEITQKLIAYREKIETLLNTCSHLANAEIDHKKGLESINPSVMTKKLDADYKDSIELLHPETLKSYKTAYIELKTLRNSLLDEMRNTWKSKAHRNKKKPENMQQLIDGMLDPDPKFRLNAETLVKIHEGLPDISKDEKKQDKSSNQSAVVKVKVVLNHNKPGIVNPEHDARTKAGEDVPHAAINDNGAGNQTRIPIVSDMEDITISPDG